MYLFRHKRLIIVAIKLAAIIIISAMIMACPPEPTTPDSGNGNDNGSGNGNDNGSGNGGASGNIDSDSDGLIDINTIEDLNNIRYNLEGTSYKTSARDTGSVIGCPTDGCSGYELMRSLNFDTGAHYASGAVNDNWRPDNTTPDNATNAGWAPIGDADAPFAASFEGNDNTITGLYTRGSGSIALFGATNSESEIRNIRLIESASYGGDNADFVGALVGRNGGTITSSDTTDGTANGGGNNDSVGALVGHNTGSITASYTTNGTANGGAGIDFVGALVGLNNGGSITESYTTDGTSNGGTESDSTGALVGFNNGGSITASYTTNGTANDDQGFIGTLVGFNVQGTITASYTDGGSANGSDSSLETVGGLVGSNWGGRIIESYASATANGGGGGRLCRRVGRLPL